MTTPLPTIAAFDFDGTLTKSDTLIPFLRFSFGTKKTAVKLLALLPRLSFFFIGKITRQEAKELILTEFLKGMPLNQVEELGQKFAKGPLMDLVKPEGLKKFHWHKNKGHTCILVSANLSFYLNHLAPVMGFDHVLASQAAIDENNCLTGKLEGANCYGPEKMNRLTALLGPRSGYILYAYGNSRGDAEMLANADHSFYCRFT
jgi:HAD superfamily hydrolase (TIGR01490 family)